MGAEIQPFERFMAAVTAYTAAAAALTPEQKEQLGGDLPRDVVKSRQQAGQNLRYVEGWYVIERLNQVFGFDGWSFEQGAITITAIGDKSVVHVPVVLRACGTQRGDVGAAVTAGKSADALETALKAAVTDGLKRAARSFGTTFGNRLYDKLGTGIGISTKAEAMLREIDDATSIDEVNAWVKANVEAVGKLASDEQDIVKGACATRRREIATDPTEPPSQTNTAPAQLPPPSASPAQVPSDFAARVAEIELPGEAVAVWLKHRASLVAAGEAVRVASWAALCEHTQRIGKMRNAALWLEKAVAEEDARDGRQPAAAPQPPSSLDTYRSRCAEAPTFEVLVATHLELSASVAGRAEEAKVAVRARVAGLGGTTEAFGRALSDASAITREPGHWATVGKVLSDLHRAETKAAVGAVVKAHGTSVAKLPTALKDRLNTARVERLRAFDAPPPMDTAALLEDEIRRASTLPEIDAVHDKITASVTARMITPDQAKALVDQYNRAANALEQGQAA